MCQIKTLADTKVQVHLQFGYHFLLSQIFDPVKTNYNTLVLKNKTLLLFKYTELTTLT